MLLLRGIGVLETAHGADHPELALALYTRAQVLQAQVTYHHFTEGFSFSMPISADVPQNSL